MRVRRTRTPPNDARRLDTTMAGTYLQQDVYGEIPDVTPLFDAATMSDHQLVELVRNQPAVRAARKHCEWVVATSMYQSRAAALRPPKTDTPECWLAFLDRDEHSAPGWTKVPMVLFSSYERNENIFKVMLPAVLSPQRLVYLNHALPQARCLSLPHLIRARELVRGAADQPHLLASKIPSWSGRAMLPGQLDMTQGYLQRRNATSDMTEFETQVARMSRAGFNTSQRVPVTDTLWMVWPTGDQWAERMSRLWLHEVARFSSYEKVSYAWVAAQVPAFRPRLTDAIYIYSPEQRNCGGSGSTLLPTSGSTRKSRKARSHRRLRGPAQAARHLRRRSS